MNWFDTHCHVAGEAFDADRAEVLARAWQAGLAGLLAVGSDGASSRAAQALAAAQPRVWAAAGVHPHQAAAAEGEIGEIEAVLDLPRVVAVGEIGLDYHYDFAPRAVQLRVLERQLDLAARRRLPVILHVREAEEDLFRVLAGARLPAGGVWHCFTGTREAAERALEVGLHLGFGGILTFRGADGVRAVAAWAPLDRILLETDAPYLAPVPWRGRRNEPAFVAETGRRLAELRGLAPEELARATTANAARLFRLTLPAGEPAEGGAS
ncbi:MAG: TatD family hydrolase [Firmicutes bacterium]|nr:TatD family hydrolase [Bacillota bacterium]